MRGLTDIPFNVDDWGTRRRVAENCSDGTGASATLRSLNGTLLTACFVQGAAPRHELQWVSRAAAATIREADVQLKKVNLLSRNTNLKSGGREVVPTVARRRQEVRSAIVSHVTEDRLSLEYVDEKSRLRVHDDTVWCIL